MSATSCWPSASICSAGVYPSDTASRTPAIIAPPLPGLCSSRNNVSVAPCRLARPSSTSAQTASLPSSTTMTSSWCARTASTMNPMVCGWLYQGITATVSYMDGPGFMGPNRAAAGLLVWACRGGIMRVQPEAQAAPCGIGQVGLELQCQVQNGVGLHRTHEFQDFQAHEPWRYGKALASQGQRPVQQGDTRHDRRRIEMAFEYRQVRMDIERSQGLGLAAFQPLHGGHFGAIRGRHASAGLRGEQRPEQRFRRLALCIDRQCIDKAPAPWQSHGLHAAGQRSAEQIEQNALAALGLRPDRRGQYRHHAYPGAYGGVDDQRFGFLHPRRLQQLLLHGIERHPFFFDFDDAVGATEQTKTMDPGRLGAVAGAPPCRIGQPRRTHSQAAIV